MASVWPGIPIASLTFQEQEARRRVAESWKRRYRGHCPGDHTDDFTTGPITRHLLKTTGLMLVMMIFQTLYFLIDLYWVGRLGTPSVAAVGIAGNLTFVVLALTQMLGVGTTTVVSHAAGRKDRLDANRLFNQSQVLATGAAFLVVGLALRTCYSAAMSARRRCRR